MAGVRFEALSKSYPARGGEGPVEVIRSLSLAIDEGEFLVLVGPSGCGKSTLLRLMAGLESPSSGEIWVGNQAVSQLRPAKRNVAMVFQSYALYPHLSVRDNLGFGLRRSRQRSAVDQLQDQLHRNTRWLPGNDCNTTQNGKPGWSVVCTRSLPHSNWSLSWIDVQKNCQAGRSSGWPWAGLWPGNRRCF